MKIMKPYLKKMFRSVLVPVVCFSMMNFIQTDSTSTLHGLGKGSMYLKENRVIKNIRVRELKAYWIVFEKNGSLHDRMIDEIARIEFPEAKPEPVIMVFENNRPVLKKIKSIGPFN